jgi:GNAT superfamily N-acetyltransferase
MLFELNDLETARFGIVAARLTGADVPLEAVNAAAAEAGVRMVTVRVEASDLSRVHALEADGYRLMDTLVYYARSLEGLPASLPLPEGISLRLATPSDAPAVAEVARSAFAGYFGHYHADPRLDSDAADAAYVEWAETSTARCGSDTPVLLALRAGRTTGFLTLRRNSGAECEIVLNAVRPDVQRSGLYSAMVVRALQEGQAMGAQRMIVSTQITNAAVQRVWARQGFAFDRALYTFHKWFD